jgi:hypothetical protein
MSEIVLIAVAGGFAVAWVRERVRAARLDLRLGEAQAKLSAGGRACARIRREEEARRRDAITAQLRRENGQPEMVRF